MRRANELDNHYVEEKRKLKNATDDLENHVLEETVMRYRIDKLDICIKEETELRRYIDDLRERNLTEANIMKDQIAVLNNRAKEKDGKRRDITSNELKRNVERYSVPKFLQQEIDNKCIVCLDGSKRRAITKCGHLCYCNSCGHDIKKCPICRKDYDPNTDLIEIFST